MDAFYASVEQRDHPELRGIPIAVGHAEQRGVVSAASYEARRYGVRSAMSSLKAKQLCPHIVFVPGRMNVYKAVSAQIHGIFQEYTDLIEPLSLDEAFLDVTHNKKGIELAVDIAKEIKMRIRKELNLVASAGISYNKFLAKVASDYRKPDGLCTIHPDQAVEFISKLPIEAFWGVGKITAQKMHALGIHRGKDLQQCTLEMLTRLFGKAGHIYYDFARGIDLRPVEAERIRKSVGCEHTLDRDITASSSVIIELYHVATELIGDDKAEVNENRLEAAELGKYKDLISLIGNDKERYEKLSAMIAMIEGSYIHGYEENELWEELYRTLTVSLGDDYSQYLTAEEYNALVDSADGDFVGIGVPLRYKQVEDPPDRYGFPSGVRRMRPAGHAAQKACGEEF